MKLLTDWRCIVRRAWSFRLMALACLLSGIEVALPMFATSFPRGPFAVLSLITTGAALAARLVAQKEMHADE